MQVKYYPNETQWQTNWVTRCTRGWKGITEARDFLEQNVTWFIGDGKTYKVFCSRPRNKEQREMKVSQLMEYPACCMEGIKTKEQGVERYESLSADEGGRWNVGC